MNSKVTQYIEDKDKWTQELTLLRSVLSELPFEETIKWGSPVYVYKGKNILGMSAFKHYCGLWFFQGHFLKDEANLLMNAQEGKTKAMGQWRFDAIDKIDVNLVKAYALEAIENSEKGLEIKPQRNKKPLVIPPELGIKLNEDLLLKEKFNQFTLSKQREFADHIASAKREATKTSRLEKIIPMILNGVGLHDKYKNC